MLALSRRFNNPLVLYMTHHACRIHFSTLSRTVKRPLLLAAALFCVAGLSAAEPRQRLANGWEFHQGALGSTWELWRGDKASDNVTWTPVTLPHCFNARDAVDPDVRYYQGPGWYRTRLKLENPYPDGRTLLHFNGAGQRSEVFVGLEKVGEHFGGYDEWTVDITDAAARAQTNTLFNGEVPVAVRCDNSRDAESIPSDLSDFNRYGGLYRHVSLVYVPAISLQRIRITPTLAKDGNASVTLTAVTRASVAQDPGVEFTVEIRDPQDNVIHSVTRTNCVSFSSQRTAGFYAVDSFSILSPQLWSPKTPWLYHCSITLKSPHGEHTLTERFGVRSVEWIEHGPFKLNGERLLLRGTHYHEDHAGVAAAVPDEVVRRTMQQIKDMGANFVRLGHYQQAPLVLDLCDELGLLVWEEIPWCRGGLGGPRFQQQCRDMLRNLIDQHYNHPSVILWGLGNENDWPGDFETFDTNAIRTFMTELNTLAHRLDPSRKTSIRRCDFCKDIVDVYSPSMWAGWYSGRYPEYRKSTEKAIADTPHFFHAEWGGDSHAGRHAEDPERFIQQVATGQGTAEVGKAYKATGGKARASKDGDWSESYIINLFDWHLKEQEQIPDLTGAAQWIFKDFSTPLRPENPVPRVNQKGVVERDGMPKESYYVFQSYWAEKPMLHIYGHTWPVRWGKPGEEKLVKVYSNCGEVELFVNGVSAGVKLRDATNYPAAGLHWRAKFNEGDNTLRAVGRSGFLELTDELRVRYQTATWGEPAGLTLTELAQRDGIATVEVRVFDKQGVPCLDAANLVRFGLTGDGRLLDNLGTVRGSRAVQLANGRAQLSARLTGREAVISVASEGLPTAFLRVTNASESGASVAAESEDVVPIPAANAVPVLTVNVAKKDRERILKAAEAALNLPPITITDFRAKLSEGGPNDFYSNGDYWWPDPAQPDGLPYVQRDGESNPDNFAEHRRCVAQLRDAVAALGAAYRVTGEDRYAVKAAELLRVFFLEPTTRMNPHLNFAQAIPGRTPGRGIGIIDTLHLAEVPVAIEGLAKSPSFLPAVLAGVQQWFRDYTEWMLTSKNGQEEASAKNNHSVAFWLQVACFARFTGDEATLAECRRQFKEVFVPNQMAADGSFPLELKRTKPYGYSIFQLDNMATLCQVLSTPDDNLWSFELPDGRGIRKAMAYLYPYLADKSKWPLKPDVQAWDGWPARQPALLFTGLAYAEVAYLNLWLTLPADPTDAEVRRNMAITQPLLWVAGP
jgi:beta-galactosidase